MIWRFIEAGYYYGPLLMTLAYYSARKQANHIMLKAVTYSNLTVFGVIGVGTAIIINLHGSQFGDLKWIFGLPHLMWAAMFFLLLSILSDWKRYDFPWKVFIAAIMVALATEIWEVPVHILTFIFLPWGKPLAEQLLVTASLSGGYLLLAVPLVRECRSKGNRHLVSFTVITAMIVIVSTVVSLVVFPQFPEMPFGDEWLLPRAGIAMSFLWLGLGFKP